MRWPARCTMRVGLRVAADGRLLLGLLELGHPQLHFLVSRDQVQLAAAGLGDRRAAGEKQRAQDGKSGAR